MSELEIPIEYYVREISRDGDTHHPPFQIYFASYLYNNSVTQNS